MDDEIRKGFNNYISKNTQLKRLFDDLSTEDGIMLQVFMEGFARTQLEQSQEPRPNETLVIAPKWETPDEFGLYEIFDDGSYEFLEGELFWGLVEVKNNKTGKIKNEVYLCGINDNGLYAYDPENDVDYYPGWCLEDIQYCMRYEKKGQ
jgi:hypothetical protein